MRATARLPDRGPWWATPGAGALLPVIGEAAEASTTVWLAAYVPDFAGGLSMADDIRAHRDAMFHLHWLGVDPASDKHLAMRFLFHDCAADASDWTLGTLRLFSPGPAVYQHPAAPLSPAAQRLCIVPTGDRPLRPEWMREAARERLGVEAVEVSTGHCTHVSQPEAFASVMCQI